MSNRAMGEVVPPPTDAADGWTWNGVELQFSFAGLVEAFVACATNPGGRPWRVSIVRTSVTACVPTLADALTFVATLCPSAKP